MLLVRAEIILKESLENIEAYFYTIFQKLKRFKRCVYFAK
jgi:hypothetical protein